MPTITLLLIAPSEGSVIAYYLSEFRVPVGQEAAVDSAMAAMDKLVEKEQRSLKRPGNSLVLEDVVSSGKSLWFDPYPSCCFACGL